MINNKLWWNEHVKYVCGKTSKRIYFLVLLKRAVRSPSDIIETYKAVIRSGLEYVCIVWHPAVIKQQSDKIEHIQKRCPSIACPDFTHEKPMTIHNLDTLQERWEVLCTMDFMSIQNESHRLHYLLPPSPQIFCFTTKF